MVDITELKKTTKKDFAASGVEFGFESRVVPTKIKSLNKPQLQWNSIKYKTGDDSIIPNNQPGIYAFAISHTNQTLPENCYILYIGISSSLHRRYKEYLNTSIIKQRSNICRMISTWHSVLQFYFAPITDKNIKLKEIEEEMNDALGPFFSINDYSSEVRKAKKAF